MNKFGIEIRKSGTIGAIYEDVDRVLSTLRIGPGEINYGLQQQGVAHSLQKMFKEHYFSVCTIDACAKLAGIHISGERRDLYQSVHCLNWGDMEPDFRTRLIALVLDDFRCILNP